MIKKTSDYSLFKRTRLNRECDPGNIKKIAASLKIKNMMHLRPILVNSDMEIIDGQHRLEAAKSLGIEVYYDIVQGSDDEDIILLNSAQRNWKAEDYVRYYATKGLRDYSKLLEFSKETGLSIRMVLRLFGPKSGRTGNPIHQGKFKMPEKDSDKYVDVVESLDMLRTIVDFLRHKCLGNKLFLSQGKFQQALIDFLCLKNIDKSVFFNKVQLRIDIFGSRQTGSQYYALFREVYNYRNQDPLP